jgi:drug/metabolite transporter (DMT)-like permease
VLTYLLAVLAAAANAGSSVLQRKAHRDHPMSGSLLAQVVVVLRVPTWLFGISAVIAGFLLQAAALNHGAISVVEPVLVVELPFTLLLAGFVFRRRLSKQDWLAIVVMTIGVAGLLYALAPNPRPGERVTTLAWLIGAAANILVVAAL